MSRATAASASSVLPVAIGAAVQIGALVIALATKAPIQIAGHNRGLQSSKAAMAMPLGGHTVVTCSATNATLNPSCAERT